MKTTLALTMALGFGLSVAGCSQKVSRLQIDYDGDWGFNVSAYSLLDGTKRYEKEEQYGNYAVFSTPETSNEVKTYYLVDLEKGVIVHNSTDEFEYIDEGMFYTEKNGVYTLYLPNSSAEYEAGKAGVEGNFFIDYKNHTRTYIDVKGEVRSTVNPYERVLCYGDSYTKAGDRYVKLVRMPDLYMVDDYQIQAPKFEIYDKNGKYEKTVDLGAELGIATDEVIEGTWGIDDTMYLQTVRALPDTEEEYDYSVDTEKFDLTTYAYNFAKCKGDVWDDFEYVVEGGRPISEKASLVYVQKIENKKLSAKPVLQVFDKKGGLYMDVQSLVPGAMWLYSAQDYVYLIDSVDDVHIFKDGKKVCVLPEDANYKNGYIMEYDSASDILGLYNVNDGYSYTETANVTGYPTTLQWSKLVYKVENPETNTLEIRIFDTDKGTASVQAFAATQQVHMGDSYAVAYDENGTIDLYFYATGEMIEDLNDYQSVGSFYLDGKDMTLIYTQKGEVGTYYMITETYPTSEYELAD